MRSHSVLLRKKSPGWGRLGSPETALSSIPDFSLSESEGTACGKHSLCPSLLTQSTSNHRAHALGQMASTGPKRTKIPVVVESTFSGGGEGEADAQ